MRFVVRFLLILLFGIMMIALLSYNAADKPPSFDLSQPSWCRVGSRWDKRIQACQGCPKGYFSLPGLGSCTRQLDCAQIAADVVNRTLIAKGGVKTVFRYARGCCYIDGHDYALNGVFCLGSEQLVCMLATMDSNSDSVCCWSHRFAAGTSSNPVTACLQRNMAWTYRCLSARPRAR